MDSQSMSASCIWFCSQVSVCVISVARNTYSISVLNKGLVVSTDCNKEEQAVDVLEAVDPLLTFRSLSSNVKHTVCEGAKVEDGLGDTSRPQSGAQNVLVCWHVIWSEQSVHILEVTMIC